MAIVSIELLPIRYSTGITTYDETSDSRDQVIERKHQGIYI